jgi:hypothetical protein
VRGHFIRWIAFLIRPELKIKMLRHKNPTIVKFEINDSGRNKQRGGENNTTSHYWGPYSGIEDYELKERMSAIATSACFLLK